MFIKFEFEAIILFSKMIKTVLNLIYAEIQMVLDFEKVYSDFMQLLELA